jgi:3-oxoacyl-[acyl-carrier-protein] synthase-3
MTGGTCIAGLGHHAPQRVVGNDEIESLLNLEPGWVEPRTGIRTRRWAAADETLSGLALPAASQALEEAGTRGRDVGLLLLATSTPEHLLPPTAPLLAHRLGLPDCGAVDLTGACAGFLYALVLADAHVRASGRAVLVVAANILSRRLDMRDRNTVPLFADAAGAILLAPEASGEAGLIAATLTSDGAGYPLIQVAAPGTPPGSGDDASPRIVMRNGRDVYVRAVRMMTDACVATLRKAGTSAKHVAHFVPHQANARMMSAVADELGIDPTRMAASIAQYGNSSAATIPLTLSVARQQRSYRRGELVLLAAAGAGLTGGAALYRL